jgi:hypothetical protein
LTSFHDGSSRLVILGAFVYLIGEVLGVFWCSCLGSSRWSVFVLLLSQIFCRIISKSIWFHSLANAGNGSSTLISKKPSSTYWYKIYSISIPCPTHWWWGRIKIWQILTINPREGFRKGE